MGSSKTKQTTSHPDDPLGSASWGAHLGLSNAQDAYGRPRRQPLPRFCCAVQPGSARHLPVDAGYTNGNPVPGRGRWCQRGIDRCRHQRDQGCAHRPRQLRSDQAEQHGFDLIDAAKQYVAGQDIDGQVNDAMLNARRRHATSPCPGIEQNAAMTGNTNSSRTGIADGLVERGLAEQSATSVQRCATARSRRPVARLGQRQREQRQQLGALTHRSRRRHERCNSGVNAGSSSITIRATCSTWRTQAW
jgi:hypothetical protein